MKVRLHGHASPYRSDHTLSWGFGILPKLSLGWWSHRDTEDETFRIFSIHVGWLLFGAELSFEFGEDEGE